MPANLMALRWLTVSALFSCSSGGSTTPTTRTASERHTMPVSQTTTARSHRVAACHLRCPPSTPPTRPRTRCARGIARLCTFFRIHSHRAELQLSLDCILFTSFGSRALMHWIVSWTWHHLSSFFPFRSHHLLVSQPMRYEPVRWTVPLP